MINLLALRPYGKITAVACMLLYRKLRVPCLVIMIIASKEQPVTVETEQLNTRHCLSSLNYVIVYFFMRKFGHVTGLCNSFIIHFNVYIQYNHQNSYMLSFLNKFIWLKIR